MKKIVFIFVIFSSSFLYARGSLPEDREVVKDTFVLYRIDGKRLYFKNLDYPFIMTKSFTQLIREKKVNYSAVDMSIIQKNLPAKVEITYKLPILTEEGAQNVEVIYIKFLEIFKEE